jgi:hypothetical protein
MAPVVCEDPTPRKKFASRISFRAWKMEGFHLLAVEHAQHTGSAVLLPGATLPLPNITS